MLFLYLILGWNLQQLLKRLIAIDQVLVLVSSCCRTRAGCCNGSFTILSSFMVWMLSISLLSLPTVFTSSFISIMLWTQSCLKCWSRNIWNTVDLINCSITAYINSLAYILRQLNTIINMFWKSSFQRLSKVNTICPLSPGAQPEISITIVSLWKKKGFGPLCLSLYISFRNPFHHIFFFVYMDILNSSILDGNPYMSLKNALSLIFLVLCSLWDCHVFRILLSPISNISLLPHKPVMLVPSSQNLRWVHPPYLYCCTLVNVWVQLDLTLKHAS